MEAAKAEEAFLQEKGEGRTKVRRRHVTDIDPVVTTPMGMAMATMETMTRGEQADDPLCRDATSRRRGDACRTQEERGRTDKASSSP